MTKRAHGEGTVERHGAGWRARARIDGRRVDLGTHPTTEAAEAVLRGTVALRAAGAVVGGTTLRQYGTRWLDRRELGGVRSIRTDRYRWDRLVLAASFADDELGDIRPRDVRAWLDELGRTQAADRRGRRRISWQTKKHALNLLRSCLRAAVEDELLATNPAAGARLPRPAGQGGGWTYLLPSEQDRLLAAPTKAPLRLLVAIGIGTGMRQGEQWALELVDVHVAEDESDPHLVVRYGGPNHMPPKNGRVRRVPLWGSTLDAMRAWLEQLPRFAPSNPRGLAFPSPRGCHRDKKPPRGWPKLLASAGLADASARHDGRHVRWHDLRHTCASSLVAGWWGRRWTLDEVREVLGHSSVTVTERYAHLAPGVLASAAAEADQLAPALAPGSRMRSAILERFRCAPGATRTPDLRLRRPIGSAVVARGYPTAGAGLGPDELRALAERYLRAVASRSRLTTRHGVELAEEVLAATAAERGRAAG